MSALRRLLRRRNGWACWLLACALAMKLLVPGGYMMTVAADGPHIVQCTGFAPAVGMQAMAGHHGQHDKGDDHRRADMPCAFAGLAAATLAAADPLLPALAIAFVMALVGRRPSRPLATTSRYRRPPLRGPPLPA